MRRTILAIVILLLAVVAADAQYFGRNKVQWEEFDFHVLETEHFDVYYYPERSPAVEDAARMAERWYERLSGLFDHTFAERKPIVLYADHADFQQNTISGGLIGQGVGGFTESLQNRLVMPLTGSYADTDHVLGHEMVHVFQFDIFQTLATAYRRSQLHPLPLWMTEGLAEYLSVGPADAHTAMWLRDAVIRDDLPTMRDLSRDPRYFPYRWGQAFWAYVGGRWGSREAVKLYVNALVHGIEPAMEEVLGISADELFTDWHVAIRNAARPVIDRYGAGPEGRPLIAAGDEGASLNVAPAVSADGRRLAFLSSRDLFEIDLFVADADTGEVRGKLVSAASDPHFDALRFLDSAGSWSPGGDRLAFVVFAEGDNRIAIAEEASGDIVRRLQVPGLEAILNLAWSPDGRWLAVSGSSRGTSDLYLVEVETGDVTRLTNDPYADLQPAWSPDSETLVLVTDRVSGTDLDDLETAPLGLALLDVATGEIRPLTVFQGAKHISPQFSPDGESLYLVSDPDGVSNVYRYHLASGAAYRVTDVVTGVTGITAEAPALSVARGTGQLAYTVFSEGEYAVYTLSASEAVGEPFEPEAELRAAILPPQADRADELLADALRSPEEGLPPPTAPAPESYSPKMRLAAVGPMTVGAGTDQYGFGVSGGVNLYFTDILGNHQAGVSFSGLTYADDELLFAGEATYLNRSNRLNWGITGTHVPYRRAGTFIYRDTVDIDGTPAPADIVERIRETVTVDRAGAIALYPLSLNRRLEARAGYNKFSFDADVEQLIYVGGALYDRREADLPTQPGYSYTSSSLAYVVDTSYFGFTSPLRGTRARFEAGTVFGDFEFQTALADFRRYWFFRPASFAVRGMHYGRYGVDDDNGIRLAPLNVGQGTLIRGYDIGSFDLSECTPIPTGTGCAEYERLEGDRIAVVNLELRLQVLGTEALGLVEAPFMPTELAAFVDVGAAWSEGDSLDVRFEERTPDRVPVVSAGIAARLLVGGYVPIELSYAYPFQRPEAGWQFGFVIAPGF